MNWPALVVIVIWICATIASVKNRDSEPFISATFVTLLGGIGYFMYLICVLSEK